MFPWSNVHVMNTYVDNVWNRKDNTNSPEENVAPQFTAPYPKIYPIKVPRLISYVNTSTFIIVFVDSGNAW